MADNRIRVTKNIVDQMMDGVNPLNPALENSTESLLPSVINEPKQNTGSSQIFSLINPEKEVESASTVESSTVTAASTEFPKEPEKSAVTPTSITIEVAPAPINVINLPLAINQPSVEKPQVTKSVINETTVNASATSTEITKTDQPMVINTSSEVIEKPSVLNQIKGASGMSAETVDLLLPFLNTSEEPKKSENTNISSSKEEKVSTELNNIVNETQNKKVNSQTSVETKTINESREKYNAEMVDRNQRLFEMYTGININDISPETSETQTAAAGSQTMSSETQTETTTGSQTMPSKELTKTDVTKTTTTLPAAAPITPVQAKQDTIISQASGETPKEITKVESSPESPQSMSQPMPTESNKTSIDFSILESRLSRIEYLLSNTLEVKIID